MTEKHKLPIIHYLAICKSPFVRFDNFCKKNISTDLVEIRQNIACDCGNINHQLLIQIESF